MHVTIGHSWCYDQHICIRMMHPSGICLSKNNVFKLSSGALWRALISPMCMYLGRTPRFLNISISSTTTFPCYVRPSKDCQYLPYPFWTLLSWSLIHVRDLSVTMSTLHLALSDTRYSSIRSWNDLNDPKGLVFPYKPWYLGAWIPLAMVPHVSPCKMVILLHQPQTCRPILPWRRLHIVSPLMRCSSALEY